MILPFLLMIDNVPQKCHLSTSPHRPSISPAYLPQHWLKSCSDLIPKPNIPANQGDYILTLWIKAFTKLSTYFYSLFFTKINNPLEEIFAKILDKLKSSLDQMDNCLKCSSTDTDYGLIYLVQTFTEVLAQLFLVIDFFQFYHRYTRKKVVSFVT